MTQNSLQLVLGTRSGKKTVQEIFLFLNFLSNGKILLFTLNNFKNSQSLHDVPKIVSLIAMTIQITSNYSLDFSYF